MKDMKGSLQITIEISLPSKRDNFDEGDVTDVYTATKRSYVPREIDVLTLTCTAGEAVEIAKKFRDANPNMKTRVEWTGPQEIL